VVLGRWSARCFRCRCRWPSCRGCSPSSVPCGWGCREHHARAGGRRRQPERGDLGPAPGAWRAGL